MTLRQATSGAVTVACLVLLVAVLPAEYGIDPTGIGEATGLMDLYKAGAGVAGPSPAVITPDPSGPLVPQPARYKVDPMAFTLPPNGAIEYRVPARRRGRDDLHLGGDR